MLYLPSVSLSYLSISLQADSLRRITLWRYNAMSRDFYSIYTAQSLPSAARYSISRSRHLTFRAYSTVHWPLRRLCSRDTEPHRGKKPSTDLCRTQKWQRMQYPRLRQVRSMSYSLHVSGCPRVEVSRSRDQPLVAFAIPLTSNVEIVG